MGFLGGGAGMAGAAGGANQALQNFLQFYLHNKQLEQNKLLQAAHIKEYEAHANERADKLRREKAMEADVASLYKPTEEMAPVSQGGPPVEPGMFGVNPELDIPIGTGRMIPGQPTANQLIDVLGKYNLPAAVTAKIKLAGQQEKGGLTAKDIISNVDKFDDKTLAVFSKILGIDLGAYRKPEKQPLITGPGGVRIPDVAGAEVGEKTKPRSLKGFDKESGVSVYADPNTDQLVLEDGTPYTGGQLKPITEPGTVTVLDRSTVPEDMEKLADAIEAGRTTMSTVAKGMGGAHTAREVSRVLEGRGVDVASLEVNLAAKRSATAALEKTVNQLKPFEETARANLNYAKSLSHQYVRSRFPDINRLKQMWDAKTGDPLVEKFKVATYDGMMESMKHMLAGSGITAAELSIGAQKKSEELMSTIKSWEQFDAIVEAIDTGLVNRATAYKNQLKALKEQSIVNFTAPAAPTQPSVPGVMKNRPLPKF